MMQYKKKKITTLSSLLLCLSSFSLTCAVRISPLDRGVLNNATTTTAFRRHLIGEKVDVPVATSPDDHLVTDLPLLDNSKFPTDQWAGLLPASDDGHKYLFYWLFAPTESNKADEDIPLLIWLNGGPACSSMDGLWLENGPFRLTKKSDNTWTIDIDEFSWHTAPAYVVYIDQPVGTGISFTTNAKYPHNDEEVNIDFYYFLQQFLQLHSDKFVSEDNNVVKRPLYFSGESHAGHYIPSMMNYIQQQNAKIDTSNNSIRIPLSGAAIGNGWVDPKAQYSAHEVAYGYGLIGRAQKRALEKKEEQCQRDLAKGIYVSSVCFDLLDDVVGNSQGHGSQYKVSQYDQRKWEKKSSPRDFPPGHKDVEAYLGGWGSIAGSDYTQVLEAIHSTPSKLSGQRYKECTDPPYNALKHQDGLGVTGDVVDLLNNGVRMLFFNGIHDLICNHVGNEIMVENLEWNHQEDYQLAKRYGWQSSLTNQLAGYMKEFENLMYLKVIDSGHMVPMDVPDVSLDMMRTLMFQGNFDNFEQRINREKQSDSPANCPVCPQVPAATPAECPVCPECPTDESNSNQIPPKDGSNTTTIEIPEVDGQIVVAAAVSALVVFLCLCYCCYCRSNKAAKKERLQYDMELPRHGGYHDELEDEYGETK